MINIFKLIVRFLACLCAIFVMNFLFPSNIVYDSYGALAVASIVLSIVYMLIRPLIQLISIPFTCLTFGFFSLMVNGGLIKLVSGIVPGFYAHGFWECIGVGVIISIIDVLTGYKKINNMN